MQETEIAKLEAARQEQRLNATVYKEADAAAYAKRVQAEATKSADISAAEASARKVELAATADARKVELAANAEATAAESRARATRTTGEAEAAATTARGTAAASASRAMAVAEADGIEARANALSTNQDAVIAQQLAEQMPEIVRAAAEPFAHVGQMTVLNGAEGLNSMVSQHHRPGRYAAAAAHLRTGQEPAGQHPAQHERHPTAPAGRRRTDRMSPDKQ